MPKFLKCEYLQPFLKRFLSTQPPKCNETDLKNILIKRFPKANVTVHDVSGGCGAMFEVLVEAKEFSGLSVLKQHKMITETLKEQINDMHGLRIHTKVPDNLKS